MKKLTIVGSGATAHAAAATFTLLGHQVTLTDVPQNAGALDAIRERGGVLLRGNGLTGHALPENITTDVAGAVKGADAVLISVVANRHEEIAHEIAPGLHDNQLVVVVPGNAGGLLFDRIFREAGKHVLVGELQGNLFPCRLTGPAEVLAGGGLRRKRIAAFPAYRTADAIAALEGVLDLEPARHIFETTLNSPNIINHLITTVLNASAIDKAGEDFALFLHGLTPTVFKGLDRAWEEWKRVLDALGYWQMGSPVEHLRKVAERGKYPELDVFRSLDGPSSLQHRYVSEDAPTSIALFVSLAHKANVPAPFTQALLTVASALNGIDYYGEGRTLESFGLESYSLDEIESYLQKGE